MTGVHKIHIQAKPKKYNEYYDDFKSYAWLKSRFNAGRIAILSDLEEKNALVVTKTVFPLVFNGQAMRNLFDKSASKEI